LSANLTKPIADLAERLPHAGTLGETLAAARIKRAHKFVLDVDAIPYDVFKGGADYADQLAEFGLLKLPFDECVFLIGPYDDDHYEAGNFRKIYQYVILAWMDGDTISYRSYEYFTANGRANTVHAAFHIPRTMGCVEWARTFKDNSRVFCTVDDNPSGEHRLCEHGALPGVHVDDPNGTAEDYQLVAGGIPGMLLYSALGCLNAQGVVTTDRPAPKMLNEKRRKKGHPPIFAYRLVTIDPAILRMPGVRGAGSHASPRLHWRRGHKRTLPDGRRVLVRACLVGDPDRGYVNHDYRIRAAG
jgi:hypothetical protein